MTKKMSNLVVAAFLLFVVSFALTSRIYSSGLQFAEEEENGGLLNQYERLLYAGGSDPGVVYEYLGGISWKIVSQELGYAVLCLCEYEGRLYAGTMSTSNPSGGIGRVWRYDGGVTWTLVGDNMDDQVCSLVVFRGKLYAGTAWGSGRLYRYEGGTSWTMVVDYTWQVGDPSTSWSGFRSLYVWNDILYIGDIYYDLFGHYDGTTFTYDADLGGCCIYDFEVYGSNLYASAWFGRIHRSSDGTTWASVRGLCPRHSWELETFQGYLYITTGPELETYDGVSYSVVWTEPNGNDVTSMIDTGDALILGTGAEAGSKFGRSGVGRVYTYDGVQVKLISSAMGKGIQALFGSLDRDWPMFRHDLRHTGHLASTAPNTNNTIWNYTIGSYVWSSPAVVDGKVYVGSIDDNVYYLNASNGAQIWNYTTGNDLFSSPAVVDGKVYVGSYDDNVYCLNASSGAQIWNYTTGDRLVSSPAVVDGKVYVGSFDCNVYCLNASSGVFIWSYTTGDYVYSSPAVVDGKVYVGSRDGDVYAFGPLYNVTIEAYRYAKDNPVSVSITMDGTPTGYTTPHTFIELEGTHTFTVPNTDLDGNLFYRWNTGESNPTITVNSNGTYTAYYPRRNIAITNVTISKTVVGQGYCVNITVTIENQGSSPETFAISLYFDSLNVPTSENWATFWSMGDVNRDGYINDIDASLIAAAWLSTPGTPNWNPDADLNEDLKVDARDLWICTFNYGSNIWTRFGIPLPPIGTQRGTKLQPGSHATLTFTWNTTGFAKGNYTINAYACPVQYEIDIADNNCTDGIVQVVMPGDCTADGKVNIYDLREIGKAYGSKMGETKYKPNADFSNDGRINIYDLRILGKNYGKKDP